MALKCAKSGDFFRKSGKRFKIKGEYKCTAWKKFYDRNPLF
ncbi:hypothetical protein Cabys_3834 [Caldithrix abyssi DSM 13497]|uniref:Uncharacterized protein n=1 Tax=Caldithrix abyssi DSM 13497 TaxID=880073 RepID=A0A1J1CCZ4_CALAY|nr:hypothetical protein Cabys_3834 [Caldithrix abyssi DSM 13497]